MWAVPAFLIAVGTENSGPALGNGCSDTSEAVRYLWMRAFHHDTTRRLADRRRALAAAVAQALGDSATQGRAG